jgi:hypothetical protein
MTEVNQNQESQTGAQSPGSSSLFPVPEPTTHARKMTQEEKRLAMLMVHEEGAEPWEIKERLKLPQKLTTLDRWLSSLGVTSRERDRIRRQMLLEKRQAEEKAKSNDEARETFLRAQAEDGKRPEAVPDATYDPLAHKDHHYRLDYIKQTTDKPLTEEERHREGMVLGAKALRQVMELVYDDIEVLIDTRAASVPSAFGIRCRQMVALGEALDHGRGVSYIIKNKVEVPT